MAGACWILSWCIRHLSWKTKAEYREDVSPAAESLRVLLREISLRLARLSKDGTRKWKDVRLASERFLFESSHIAQGYIDQIFDLSQRLRDEGDDGDWFKLEPQEVLALIGLGLELLKFGEPGQQGVERAKLSWLERSLEAKPTARFLVFTESLQTCEIIQAVLPDRAVRITGELSESERAQNLSRFLDPDGQVRVLVATSAADEGFDLQAANQVVHWDLSTSPATLMQRNGRVARLGQVADVTAYYLIIPRTHEARRDHRLRECFEELLGNVDERLRLRILGNVPEEAEKVIDEATMAEDGDGGAQAKIIEILKEAKRQSEEMDRNLRELQTNPSERFAISRDDMESRLERWSRLGLPEDIGFDVRFDKVEWKRPEFGDQETHFVDAEAAIVNLADEARKVGFAFDPEFKLFGGAASAKYALAGLRPWTARTSAGGAVVKHRPDRSVDLLGSLAASLARRLISDFAVLPRTAISLTHDQLGPEGATHLLFVTHPMREAETSLPSTPGDGRRHELPYLTFYPVGAQGIVDREATPQQVHEVVRALEWAAASKLELPEGNHLDRVLQEGRRAGEVATAWLRETRSVGGRLGGPAHYFLPIPVALVALV